LQGLQGHCLPAKAAEAKAPINIMPASKTEVNFFMGQLLSSKFWVKFFDAELSRRRPPKSERCIKNIARKKIGLLNLKTTSGSENFFRGSCNISRITERWNSLRRPTDNAIGQLLRRKFGPFDQALGTTILTGRILPFRRTVLEVALRDLRPDHLGNATILTRASAVQNTRESAENENSYQYRQIFFHFLKLSKSPAISRIFCCLSALDFPPKAVFTHAFK